MGEVTVLLHAAREGDSSAVGQDGEYGRDLTHPNSGDGDHGFRFAK
jgi:hypothetical protein